MSTLAEIEAAINELPASDVETLEKWLEKRRSIETWSVPASEPDFIARAKALWGEKPEGVALSEIVAHSRG